jgi:hypothetical protein
LRNVSNSTLCPVFHEQCNILDGSIDIEKSFKPYLSKSSSYVLEMPSKQQLEHPKRRLVIEN